MNMECAECGSNDIEVETDFDDGAFTIYTCLTCGNTWNSDGCGN